MMRLPFQITVDRKNRQLLNGHKSGLLWFTGLSGSGKSTLANSVEAHLFELGVRSYVLDGDAIRSGLNKDLGMSPEDRKENIRRVAEVAKLMVDAGLLVLAAFITPYRESRDFIRLLMKDFTYFECYVRCPLEVCELRDPKGLYKLARSGKILNMTGIGAPYEEPEFPELIIDTDRLTIKQSTHKVIDLLVERGLIAKPGVGAQKPTGGGRLLSGCKGAV